MWPGIASLELISRKSVSKFIIMLQLHRPVPSEASCPPWTAQTGSEDKVVSEHHSKVTVPNSRGRNKAPCLWPLYPNTIWCLHMTLPLNNPEKTPLTSCQKNTHTHTHTCFSDSDDGLWGAMSSSNQQQCANKGKSSLELEMSSVVLEQLFWAKQTDPSREISSLGLSNMIF